MSQKTKTIQIGQRSFTLKELPVRLVWDLLNNTGESQPMLDRYQGLLKMACPELDTEVLLDLYPSEIEELWKGFEEVNAAFLGVVRRIGLIDILIDGLKPVLEKELMLAFEKVESRLTELSAPSSLSGMDPLSGTTGSLSS